MGGGSNDAGFVQVMKSTGVDRAEIERLDKVFEQQELRRTEWIKAHSATGRSLAAAIVERATAQLEAEGLDPDDRLLQLVQQVAEEEFAAGGGAVTETAPTTG